MQTDDDSNHPPIQHAGEGPCILEVRLLLREIDRAIPLIESAESLLQKLDGESRPTASDAREGLRLRLSIVNILGPVNDLACCPEHSAARDEVATILGFYLHMLTNLFHVRFSTLGRDQYTVLKRDPGVSPTFSRLFAVREGLERMLSHASVVTQVPSSPSSSQAGIRQPWWPRLYS